MSGWSEFQDDFFADRAANIQQTLIAQIETFDKNKMRADVKPLLKTKNKLNEETALPILSDIPVCFFHSGGFYIRPFYERGDNVLVAFSSTDIDDSLNEETRAPDDSLFNLNDAFVVSGISSNKFSPPSDFSKSGLLIGHKDGNSFINITDSEINLGSKIKINLGIEAALKGTTVVRDLTTYLTAISGITSGDPAANAAALNVIKAAATALLLLLPIWESQDVTLT